MKCEIITDGVLQVMPMGGTEEFAVQQWLAGGSRVVGVKSATVIAPETKFTPPTTTATLGESLVDGAATKALTPAQNERKEVMAQLTALGVTDYPPATRTTTLKKMLENATGGNAQDKADIVNMSSTNGTAQPAGANMATAALATATSAPADPLSLEVPAVATPTAQDVKTALMALGEVKGLEAAKQLLRDCGSENITALDSAMYASVIAKAGKLKG